MHPEPDAAPSVSPPALLWCVIAAAACVAGGLHLLRPGPDRPVTAFETMDTGSLPQMRSSAGLLEATLVATPLRVTIGGASFPGAGYNGIYGGPVLRLRPGDFLRLHLINHMQDDINLHFHGLRVSPADHGDNMHIVVKPGARFDYAIRIPVNHPPGLFWYHDHALHAAEPHVTAGLSGALLIDGFAAEFPGLAGVEQKLLVLKDWSDPDCQGDTLRTQYHCRIVSINGAAFWSAHMAPGGRQLWRMSNQGANLTLHIAAPGLKLHIIGRDGLPATDGTDTSTVDIMPASRLDVLVQAGAPGKFTVAAAGVPTGRGAGFSVRRALGQVEVGGAPARAPPPLRLPHLTDLRHLPIDLQRRIEFEENANGTVFTINGRIFDPARIDLRTELGNLEEWTIFNDTPDFHEFHIHQLGFQVAEINHVTQQFSGYVDDVRVPEHGEVKLLIPFSDPQMVGHIMFHCHVLNHEDRGMMAVLEVFQPGLLHICRIRQE